MPMAVVLKDFTVNGVTHHPGEQLNLSQADYDKFVKAGWVGPTGDDDVVPAGRIPPAGADT